MFLPLIALNAIYKHFTLVNHLRKRKTNYNQITVQGKYPLARKHLYFIEFTEAISIILKTRYDILHIHWGIGGNTRKTRLRLRSLKLKENRAIKTILYRPTTKLGRKQYKALSKPNRHVLVVLNSKKAYYNKRTGQLVAEF